MKMKKECEAATKDEWTGDHYNGLATKDGWTEMYGDTHKKLFQGM